MKIPDAMKVEIQGQELKYDYENNRFMIWQMKNPFLVRLIFLFTGRLLFTITNASALIINLKKEKDIDENSSGS